MTQAPQRPVTRSLFTDTARFVDVVGHAMVGPEGISRGHEAPWTAVISPREDRRSASAG